MPTKKTITVYKVQELTDEARKRALEWLAEGNTMFGWWESTIEDAKRIGDMLGITDMDIEFSGFWSQGDGASFTGTWKYKAGSVKAIKAYAPTDTNLHRIAEELAAIAKRNGYRLTTTITRQEHRYSHARSVEIETDLIKVSEDKGNFGNLAATLRDFMNWIYNTLKAEYVYQTSEAACIESADANGYTFDEYGRPA